MATNQSHRSSRNSHWPPASIDICTLLVKSLLVAALLSESFVHCQDRTLLSEKYFGWPLGALLGPGPVTGTVFIVDESTIFIRGFSFAGSNYKLAFFMGGSTVTPDGAGFIIPDESGSTRPLGDYKEKDIVIRLPEGRTVRDLKWLSVWSRQVHANLGHVFIPPGVEIPSPLELPPLTGFAHGVRSGPISLIDAQTILVTDFWYDGEGPSAYWWMTRGPRQSPQGHRLKDENDTPKPLRAYRGESFLIRLPDSKTIYDVDYFGVYCEEFQVDFGHVRMPQNVRVPPSPRMLGMRPESKLNCEVLSDNRGFEVRWIMDGDDIVMQLVGKLQPREYMSFGLGKNDHHSTMVGADAAVTWIDEAGNGHAVDYHLSSKEQCIGNRGSCPDLNLPGATSSITLLHAAVVNGFSMITFKRPQLGVDDLYDQHIYSDGQQAIIWAIGPLNDRNEVSYHSMHNIGNMFIDFARTPSWNCPRPDESLLNQRRFQRLTAEATAQMQKYVKKVTVPLPPKDQELKTTEAGSTVSESKTTVLTMPNTTPAPPITTITASPSTEASTKKPNLQPWHIPKVRCPKDRTLWAQIGPVGGARGYQAITGRQGWGIAWYINGLLIPEVILKRGVTYTFLVEGGNDDSNGARRHPLYLTDSPEGGFEFKTTTERAKERVFGGVGITANGTILPTAEGRMCEYKITPKTNIHDIAGTYDRFEDFHRTLQLDCDNGRPGVIKFTPDAQTPDTLYYQCFTHRYLGWKIRIVDDCNEDLEESKLLHSASMISPVKLAPPSQIKEETLTVEKKKVQVPMKQSKPKQPIPLQPQLQQMGPQPPPHPHAPVPQQRRPLVVANQNRPANYGPYSPLYGSSPFHRHQLNMLPHTMLQGYHHQYQHPQMQYMSQQPGPVQQASQQMMNTYPSPVPSPQPQNIFNAPKPNPGYYYPPDSSKPQPIHHQQMTPQLPHMQPVQPNPTYPMKKFGHRAPPQSNLPNKPILNKPIAQAGTQHQTPYYVNRQPQLPLIKPQQVLPQSSQTSRRPIKQQHVSSGSFGPTSTKPPLHGGFVPITIDAASNRPPLTLDGKSQHVWFPTGAQNQTQFVQGARLNKPIKPVKKKPADIYRIVPTPETITVTSTSTTTTTTAAPLTRVETEAPTTPSPTTITASPSIVPTTIRLANESAFELLTFVPMEAMTNSSTSAITESPTRFNPNRWFTDSNAEEVGEESQRRLVMSSLNGFENLPNRHHESKPGTIDHVINEAEKTAASQQQGNTDENILSDVLRLISFNIPSGRRDSSYTPGFIPK